MFTWADPRVWFVGVVCLGVGVALGEMDAKRVCAIEKEAEAKAQKQVADTLVQEKVRENEKKLGEMKATNERIAANYENELTRARQRIALYRMRLDAAGHAAGAAGSDSSEGGDVPDHGNAGVPDEVRDIDDFKLQVAESLEAGRACQAFIAANGIAVK